MANAMLVCMKALRNLAKIRRDLHGDPRGIEDVDKVIDAVVREMSFVQL